MNQILLFIIGYVLFTLSVGIAYGIARVLEWMLTGHLSWIGEKA